MSIAEDYNNPGNLRPPKGVTYEGQVGVGDRGFAIFETAEQGRKALVQDIQQKIKNGLNTPDSFIDRYAPEGDNPDEVRDNYKIHLMKNLGLESSADPFPKDAHEKIADAITQFETGHRDLPPPPEPGGPIAGNVTNQAIESTQKNPLDEVPLPLQSLATGIAGGVAGTTAGMAKYPAVYAYHKIMDDVKQHQPPATEEVQASTWPSAKTPVSGQTRSERQTQGAVDEQGLTGRERQTGYTEATAQKAARKDLQYGAAKEVGLNPNRAFAEHPDVASTSGGLLASKQTIDTLAREKELAKNKLIERNVNLAKSVGGDWQKMAQQAANLAKNGTPEQRNIAFRFLDKMFTGLGKMATSFPGRVGQYGFGFGAAVPAAWEQYKQENPKTAGAILAGGTALGGLTGYFPKTMGALGAAASTAYALTHPEETAASMRMSDVNPTAFMGMPEEMTSPFVEQKNAGAGRGFVNPPTSPLANP